METRFKKPLSFYVRKLKKGKAVYYVRLRLPGGSWSSGKNTGQTSRGAAEAWAIQYLRNGQVVANENTTFKNYSSGFFAWNADYAIDRRATGKRISERHCIEKTALLNNRIIPALGKTKLIDIDKSNIKQFRNDLFRRGVSGATINKCLSIIGAVLESAEEKRLIQAIPKIERAAEKSKSRGILTPEEARVLFLKPWPDIRAYTANMTAAVTGLRQGEILALQRQNVKEGYLEVLRGWNQRTGRLNETTKTGRIRYVPLPGKAEVAIHELMELSPWISPEAFVFFSIKLKRKPVEGRMLTEGLYKALAGVGIDDQERRARRIDFHSWRHWFNSVLINRKIPLHKVQAITGHLSDEMTQTYYHLDDMADVREVQEQLFLDV